MIKCDICGGHFNERFLASHKRLAHGRKTGPNEQEIVEQMLSLFKRLTKDGKQNLLRRLSSATEADK